MTKNQIHQCDFCGKTFKVSELMSGKAHLTVVREDVLNPKNNVLKCNECEEQDLLAQECPAFFEL